ncbi:two-component system cell cycle response regulator DivK [Silvimonas terrae]|uniref:Two-component system cell cycle response regulator DivK n=1 Tax=Silvimonas terrae TaxID=300266 RepID=A0A840RBD9_9NEIS|nr:response regulator [Silvimonas terrae]MBB5190749.1 two-component system cell cycle response regulator DivK [Silvimonas terrae]
MARILIIEDSPLNMLLTVRILTSANHVTLEATSAAEGIDIARSALPEVILMDMHLPDMDGIAATRVLKTDPLTQAIPIIALTADAMKGDREKALACGCDEYVEKPVHYKYLLLVITRFTNSV